MDTMLVPEEDEVVPVQSQYDMDLYRDLLAHGLDNQKLGENNGIPRYSTSSTNGALVNSQSQLSTTTRETGSGQNLATNSNGALVNSQSQMSTTTRGIRSGRNSASNSNGALVNSKTNLITPTQSKGSVNGVRGTSSKGSTTSEKKNWNGVMMYSQLNLVSFPVTPIDYIKLRRIDLSFNKMISIPSVFLQNKFINVISFNISYNHIKEIPADFSLYFPKLGYFNISSNQIVMLPLTLRICQLSSLKCVDNPFNAALDGILGGRFTNLNSDCNISALNLQYFFGIIKFYLSLNESYCELKEECLIYRGDLDQSEQTEAEKQFEEGVLQMRARRAYHGFCQIVPAEIRKYNFEGSMESIESFLQVIGEEKPDEEIHAAQIVQEYMEVVKEKFQIEDEDYDEYENDLVEESEVGDELKAEEIKTSKWTKKERFWFVGMMSVVGLVLCYGLIWPFIAAILVSPDGFELFRKNYMSWIIPFEWTSNLASLQKIYHGFIKGQFPGFISKHLPLVDYHFPIWQKIWAWVVSFFNKVK